jgi:lysozyme
MFVQSACDPRDHGRLQAQGVCRDMDAVQTASIDE